jgi:hypothetical protein
MLVNIFINVLIVEAYSNQNKVIAVFFVAMVLKNAHQRINLLLEYAILEVNFNSFATACLSGFLKYY